MRLNLGCGDLTLPDYHNVDVVSGPGVDEVWDLDQHPWPWDTESVDGVVALDVYEHVEDPIGFMQELWRVCREGAKIRLRTTRWDSEQSYRDPTHKRFLTTGSFDYWRPGTDVHARYGRAYARGRHFDLMHVYPDGEELEWMLVRAGSCEGSCSG